MKLIRWLSALAYAGVIFYLSSRTWGGIELFPHADKVIHFFMYAFLAGLLVWALRATNFRGRAMLWIIAAAMTFLYGVSDEMHQLFVPGREASVFDLMANGAGAITGALFFDRLANWFRPEYLDEE